MTDDMLHEWDPHTTSLLNVLASMSLRRVVCMTEMVSTTKLQQHLIGDLLQQLVNASSLHLPIAARATSCIDQLPFTLWDDETTLNQQRNMTLTHAWLINTQVCLQLKS